MQWMEFTGSIHIWVQLCAKHCVSCWWHRNEPKMQSLLSQIRQTTNARCACDQWINEKCQENVSIVKKDLCEEEGHEGQRKVQAEHKSQVRRRKSQCWKDHADLYLPHKDFTKEKKCVCVCVCVYIYMLYIYNQITLLYRNN